ncbi:hypothetical protein [Salininema proteolyticum]|uniref:Transcriptional regulator n=2 Tax=Salininema proteolyticum TaxID=1607685 RepID=A0ABV8TTM3_9ACTN
MAQFVSRSHLSNFEGGRRDLTPAIREAYERAGVPMPGKAKDMTSSDALEAHYDFLQSARRLDDKMGSFAVLSIGKGQTDLAESLVKEAPKGRVLEIASQWAIFTGWLEIATGQPNAARSTLTKAEQWGEGDDLLRRVAIGFDAYRLEQTGKTGDALHRLEFAQRIPFLHPAQRAYDVIRQARLNVAIGQRRRARQLLDTVPRLIDAVDGEGPPPDCVYWHSRGFLEIQEARVLGELGEGSDAAQLIRASLAQLPMEQQVAEWAQKYYDEATSWEA